MWTVISPVAGPDIGSHIFVNIGGTTQEAAVRTNGHFVGGNDDILAMTTYDGQFRRNTIHRG